MISQDDPRIIMFKMKALQMGMPPAAIDAFIAQKLGETKNPATGQPGAAEDRVAQALNMGKDIESPEFKAGAPLDKVPNSLPKEDPKKEAQTWADLVEGGNAKLEDIPKELSKTTREILTDRGYKAPDKDKKTELSVDERKIIGLTVSGLSAVKRAEEMYKKDPKLLTKQLIPGHFASKEFDSVLYNAADTILRLRTGAQANESEIRGYMTRIAPSFGDNMFGNNAVDAKFKQMEDILYGSGGFSKEEIDNRIKDLSDKDIGSLAKESGVPLSKTQDAKKNNDKKSGNTIVKEILNIKPSGNNPSFSDMQNQAIQAAQKARRTQDPQQKAILMAQANAYSKAAQAQPQEKLNPVVNTAGNVQSFLGNSETLPVVGGLLGRAILPNGIGSGVGSATGEALKQAAKRGGIEAVLAPTMDERMAALKTGAVTGGTDLLLSGLLKGGKRILHPRAALSASKSAAATAAEKAGIEFQVTDGMKEAANYILEKKDYLEPAQKKILTAIVNNETLSPTEVAKMQPILRTAGRTLSNSALRSSEGQAFNHLYDTTIEQSKTLAPKMYKATVDIAKTFPKKASELEPVQRILNKAITPAAYGVATAGVYALLNKLGLTVPGQGGQ